MCIRELSFVEGTGMNGCKVSVCIPTYNYARFLPEAIDSVLNQTFTDYEILIINDCSEDNTEEIATAYAGRDRRIRFMNNPFNIGMVANWNLCLQEARGTYIKFVFGDDCLASPYALHKMVSLLDSDPAISLVSSDRNFIDEEAINVKKTLHFRDSAIVQGEAVIALCLSLQKNLVGEPSSVLFRKKDAGRGFLPCYCHIVDLEMWFHLLEKGRFAYINESLCSFRIHSKQQTAKNRKSLSAAIDNFYLYEEYMHKPYVTASPFRKRYIWYDNVYRIWKLYNSDAITKNEMLNEINVRYDYSKFLLFFPVYKCYKPLLKLWHSLRYFNGVILRTGGRT